MDEPVGIAGRIVGGNAGCSAARWSGGTCTVTEDVTCCDNKISPASATSDIPSTTTSECAPAAALLCPSSWPGAMETPKPSITIPLSSSPAVVVATGTPPDCRRRQPPATRPSPPSCRLLRLQLNWSPCPDAIVHFCCQSNSCLSIVQKRSVPSDIPL